MPLKFAKPPSKASAQIDARKVKAAQARIVYRLVTKRDRVCRSCGARGPGLHHHHLRFLSRGGPTSTANVFLACAICHRDIHGYRLQVDGASADHTLRFLRAQ